MNQFGVVVFDNPEQLYQQIKVSLGDTKIEGVHVELDPETFNLAYSHALMKMSQWSTYETKIYTLELQQYQAEYDLPEDLVGIIKMFVPDVTTPQSSYMRVADNQLMRDLFMKFSYLGSNYMINTVYEYMMFYRERGKMFGSFLHWYRRGHKLYFQPTPRASGLSAAIEYIYFRKDLREYSMRERLWIYEYVLAKSKYIISRKRNKFGASLPVDEAAYNMEIFQEAEKQLEELEKKLLTDFSPVVLPVIG